MTALTTDGVDQEITYIIGDVPISTLPYGIATQVEACNYPQTTDITYSPALPSYIGYDEPGKIYTVNQITDDSLKSTYLITVTHQVTYQISAADPTLTDTMDAVEEITIIVKPLCEVLDLFTNTVFDDPVVYNLGEPGFDLPFLFEQTSIPSGCILPMVYSLTGTQPNMLTLISDQVKLQIAESFDLTQRGRYEDIVLAATIVNPAFASFTASITFTVEVRPCQITDFTS